MKTKLYVYQWTNDCFHGAMADGFIYLEHRKSESSALKDNWILVDEIEVEHSHLSPEEMKAEQDRIQRFVDQDEKEQLLQRLAEIEARQ